LTDRALLAGNLGQDHPPPRLQHRQELPRHPEQRLGQARVVAAGRQACDEPVLAPEAGFRGRPVQVGQELQPLWLSRLVTFS
jgi:hypothetical protein